MACSAPSVADLASAVDVELAKIHTGINELRRVGTFSNVRRRVQTNFRLIPVSSVVAPLLRRGLTVYGLNCILSSNLYILGVCGWIFGGQTLRVLFRAVFSTEIVNAIFFTSLAVFK